MNATSPVAVGAPDPAVSRPSLVRAELRRFRQRRFVRNLVLLSIVGYVAAAAITFTQFDRSTPELMAQAQQRLDQLVAEQVGYHADCVRSMPAGQDPEQSCGPVPTAADFGDVSQFLPRPAFLLETNMPVGAIAFGVGFAALAFLIGGTWIGAEWSTKSMTAWLSWEPRRMRVMASKIGVLVLLIAAMAALLQLVWIATAHLLAVTKGSAEVPVDFWGELWAMQGRLVLFAVLAGLGGFALANLTRNTGAALGIAFLYFAVIETAVRILNQPAQQWLLTDNTLALIQPEGYTIRWYDAESYSGEPHEIFLSHWHGGLTLGVAVAAVLATGIVLFKRRDLA